MLGDGQVVAPLVTGPVVLASGGMDSFIAWWLTGREALNVFVDVGHKYAHKEWEAVQRLGERVPRFRNIHTTGRGLGAYELPSGIIPNRNAHLILTAATYGSHIVLGVLHGEINSDKSVDFFRAMQHVLNIGNLPQYWNHGQDIVYRVTSPLRHMTKTEAVRAYLEAKGERSWLLQTVSCYSAFDGHCGACPSCFKRWVALRNNHIPQHFHHDPVVWARETGVLIKAEDGTYDARRANEIKEALNVR